MGDLGEFVANVGFPIAVTVYLLVRMEPRLDKQTEAFNKLTGVLDKLVEELDFCHKERSDD
jgi:hypothetical protein